MTLELSLSNKCQEFASKTVSFLKNTTGCSAVVLTWYEGSKRQFPHVQVGADERMICEYYERYCSKDPLRADLLIKNAERVTTFSSAAGDYNPQLLEEYKPFLKKYNLNDEVDLLLWANGIPVASAALLHTSNSQCQLNEHQLMELQEYLQYTFSILPIVRNLNRKSVLSTIYKLTKKEQQVAELLVAGESNGTIAQIMSIELATVKTHVIHIFQKLEVSSRSKAIAMIMDQ